MDHVSTKRTAIRLGRYLFWHSITALLVFMIWCALWVESLVPSSGLLTSVTSALPMLYPLATGLLLFEAQERLAKGELDAPRWIRWSIGFALPGSLVIGLGSTFVLVIGLVGPVGIVAWWLMALILLPFAVIGLASVFVLLRVLFKTDLDELLWAEADQPLDDALTFTEDDNAELQFETENEEVQSQAEAEALS